MKKPRVRWTIDVSGEGEGSADIKISATFSDEGSEDESALPVEPKALKTLIAMLLLAGRNGPTMLLDEAVYFDDVPYAELGMETEAPSSDTTN